MNANELLKKTQEHYKNSGLEKNALDLLEETLKNFNKADSKDNSQDI